MNILENNSPVCRFYKHQWEQFRKKFFGVFVFSAFLFILTAVLAYIYFLYHPEQAQSAFAKLAESLRRRIPDGLQGFDKAFSIFINNSWVSFLSWFLGLVPLLFLPVFTIISNGAAMGIVSAVSTTQGINPFMVFISIAPHGLLELPAVLYAASLGIYLSREIFKHLFLSESSKKPLFSPEHIREPFIPLVKKVFITFMSVIFPLLLLAALIESFITPALINLFKTGLP